MSEKHKILVVDDDKELVNLLVSFFSPRGYEVITASNGEEALRAVAWTGVNMILLDIAMPGTDGLSVKARLNEDSSTADIPVIFLTAHAAVLDKVKGLGLGAEDYVTKPFNLEELLARVEAALNRRGRYEETFMTDVITGLHNVTFFKKQFELFFGMCKRYKKIFSLVMVDINDFKRINDMYGHAAGDFVLKNFASIARSTLRSVDVVTRYGGDEFAIILPEVDVRQAGIAIGRLKDRIKGKSLAFKADLSLRFSISAGIAAYDDSFTSESQMFEMADARLYEDKRADK